MDILKDIVKEGGIVKIIECYKRQIETADIILKHEIIINKEIKEKEEAKEESKNPTDVVVDPETDEDELDTYSLEVLDNKDLWRKILYGDDAFIPTWFFVEFQQYFQMVQFRWFRPVLKQKMIDDDFCKIFGEKIDWRDVSFYLYTSKYPEQILSKCCDYVSWSRVYNRFVPSMDFVREHQDKIDWNCVSTYDRYSDSFLREFHDKFTWGLLSVNFNLSENILREFHHKINWTLVSEHQKLSEKFIRDFKDKVSWIKISKHQCLSEDFIREFKDKVDWNMISAEQTLSEDFIKEFKDKVNWFWIGEKQQKHIREFRMKFNEKINEKMKYINSEFFNKG